MVSEITGKTILSTKNILEGWYKCAEWWHKEGGRRANMPLVRGRFGAKRKQTPFEGLPLVWLVG